MADEGKRFGQLVVLGSEGKHRECLCDCGLTKRVRIDHLRGGKIRSCGCLRDRLASLRAHKMREARTTHRLSKTPIYGIWSGMRSRCENPRDPAYADYGGRGITVCAEWTVSVAALARDMGPRPSPQHTIDRRNNDGNYEPANCHWATRTEQQNNRRVNRLITFDGVTKTVSEWSRITGVHHNTIAARLNRGLSPSDALKAGISRESVGLASAARQRAKTHCKNGHPFDEANTAWTPKKTRVCRACHNDREKKRQAAKRRTPVRAIAGRGQRE